MTRISAIKGITREEARRLRKEEINTVDKLWASIGKDFDEGTARVAGRTGIESGRLKELLANQTVHEGKVGEGPWWKRCWSELASALMVAALIALVAYTLFVDPTFRRDPSAADRVIVAEADLPTFRVIGPEDIRLGEGPQKAEILQDVIGRYPLAAIPRGSTVDAKQLSEAQLSLANVEDRQLLRVPLDAHALSPTVRPTDRVSLLLSPHEHSDKTPSAIVEDDLIVWSLTRGNETDSITVAATEEDLQAIKPLLGVSQRVAMMLRRVRRRHESVLVGPQREDSRVGEEGRPKERDRPSLRRGPGNGQALLQATR